MQSTNPFVPVTDWDAAYAAEPEALKFGGVPTLIATSALNYFRDFGGEPKSAAALDVGCGEGRDTVFLAHAGFHVTACDMSAPGLAKLERRVEREHLAKHLVQTQLADLTTFDLQADSYDMVIAANVLQFLRPQDVPTQIAKLKQSVKPGGMIGIGVFHPKMIDWGAKVDGHFTATADELKLNFDVNHWIIVDETEYTIYRPHDQSYAAFAFVVAHRRTLSQ